MHRYPYIYSSFHTVAITLNMFYSRSGLSLNREQSLFTKSYVLPMALFSVKNISYPLNNIKENFSPTDYATWKHEYNGCGFLMLRGKFLWSSLQSTKYPLFLSHVEVLSPSWTFLWPYDWFVKVWRKENYITGMQNL